MGRRRTRRRRSPIPAPSWSPGIIVGGTDARFYRQRGAVAYGAALFSPGVTFESFGQRFHGNDERIDVESLGLSAEFWYGVTKESLLALSFERTARTIALGNAVTAGAALRTARADGRDRDDGVGDAAAAGRDDHRVEVEGGDLGVVGGELGGADQRVDERRRSRYPLGQRRPGP